MAGGAAPMPVVVGAPRSGTTLVRLMLDAHPQLAIPPETGFLVVARELAERPGLTADAFADVVTAYPPDAPTWNDFGIDADEYRARLRALDPFTAAGGFRLFYAMYAARFSKPRWGEKTPGCALHVAGIAQVLPEARFVHVIRDGRDVSVSLRKRWFSPGHAIERQAEHWALHVAAAREQGATVPHYRELRYEDLLAAPEAELRGLCDFLELPFDAAMLDYHRRAPERLEEHRDRRRPDGSLVVSHAERLDQQALTMQPPDTGRIGVWRDELTDDEAAAFEGIAGDLLRACGYAVEHERELKPRAWWRRG